MWGAGTRCRLRVRDKYDAYRQSHGNAATTHAFAFNYSILKELHI